LSRSQVVWCVGERRGVTAGNAGWVMAKNSHSRREISVGVSDRRFVGSQKRRNRSPMCVTLGARVSRRRPSDNNFVTSCTRDLQLPGTRASPVKAMKRHSSCVANHMMCTRAAERCAHACCTTSCCSATNTTMQTRAHEKHDLETLACKHMSSCHRCLDVNSAHHGGSERWQWLLDT
jgi:hypothetical protein